MATAAGNLVVHLMARTNQFEAGMKRSAQHTVTVRRGVARLGSSLRALSGAFLGVASVAGIGALIKSNLELLDQTGKLSDRLGVTTERLQGLRHAAEITGAGAAGLDRGLEMMNRRLGEAVRGTGEARRGLETLGLSAASLVAMSPDQAFYAIAEAISGIESPAVRASVATDIFGRGAGDLINTLSLGSAGLAEMQSEAERLGMTFDRETAAAAEEANDAITRLKSAFSGAATSITADLAPGLKMLADGIGLLPAAMRTAQAAITDMVAYFIRGMGVLYDLLGKLPGSVGRSFRAAADVAKTMAASMHEDADRHRRGPRDPAAPTAPAAPVEPWSGFDAASGASALDILAPRGGDGASMPFPDLSGAESMVAGWMERIEREAELAPIGESLRRSLETPVEAFSRRMRELEDLAEFGAIDADTHIRALTKLRDEFGPEADAAAGPTRFAGAMEKGSREAYSAILASQGLGREQPEAETAKNTKKQVEMQAEANRRLAEIVAQGANAVEIPPA